MSKIDEISGDNEYNSSLLQTTLKPRNTLKVRPQKWIQSDVERYEEIKVRLSTLYPKNDLKTIMLTGTTHEQGVTTTAISFASSLARNNHNKVLIIDANIRTPRLNEVFDVEDDKGLVDIVKDKEKNVIRKTNIGKNQLYYITSGKNYLEPQSLYNSETFDLLLRTCQENFDYIIVDTSPVTVFPETKILCNKVDGIILVLESGQTKKQVARKAKKEIEESGGKILGIVVNRRKYYIPEWLYRLV